MVQKGTQRYRKVQKDTERYRNAQKAKRPTHRYEN